MRTTDCGETGWLGNKTLYVTSPAGNRSPDFEVGWTRPGTRSHPVNIVVHGEQLDLVLLDEPEPYDPDGDTIYFMGFDPNSANTEWLKEVMDGTTYEQHRVVMNDLGVQSIQASMRDQFGAIRTKTASVLVVPPNPVAQPSCPSPIKENREIPSHLFDSSRSYSPMGRSLDHSRDEWTGKESMYFNGTTEDMTVRVGLHVYDNRGLKSLSPGYCDIVVKPDEPPVAVLDVEPLGIREVVNPAGSYDFINKSYSPDNDEIVSAEYRYKYDSNNNGFEDDQWIHLDGDLIKASLTPTQVGKYLIELTVTEDYGKQDTTSEVIDIVNLAPSVSFEVEGKNEEPAPDEFQIIPPHNMIHHWELYQTNTNTRLYNKPHMWSMDDGNLFAGLGKGMEKQEIASKSFYFGNNSNQVTAVSPMLNDNGFGPNSLSAYRGIASRNAAKSQPVLIPVDSRNNFTTGNDYHRLVPAQFEKLVRTNKTYIYFDRGNQILALNKNRIPDQSSSRQTLCGNDGTANCNGYNHRTERVHTWHEENPYDFAVDITPFTYEVPFYNRMDMINDPNWRSKADAGDFSGASQTKTITVNNPSYEITGSRIYLINSVHSITKYLYYDNNSSSGQRGQTEAVQGSYVRTFDSYTGEYLGVEFSPIQIPNNPTFVTRGDNLIFVNLVSNNNLQVYEIDRTGKVSIIGRADLGRIHFTTERVHRGGMFGNIATDNEADYYSDVRHIQGLWKDENGNIYTFASAAYFNAETDAQVQFDPILNPDIPGGFRVLQITPNYKPYAEGVFETKQVRTTGDSQYHNARSQYDPMWDAGPILTVNPKTNQAVVRTYSAYSPYGAYFQHVSTHTDLIDFNTETKGPWNRGFPTMYKENYNPPFTFSHTGATVNSWTTATASGTFEKHDNWRNFEVTARIQNPVYQDQKTTNIRYGELVGDGIQLSVYAGINSHSGPGFNMTQMDSSKWMFLDVGTPHSANTYPGFQIGQFVSLHSVDHIEFGFALNMENPREESEKVGFSFRMQDPRNRYAIETDGTTLFLAKYVNGTREVMESIHYPFQRHIDYRFRIETVGDRIQVFLNQVPYFDVRDTNYLDGKYGPFSDKSYVTFKNITTQKRIDPAIEWSTSYAIWDEDEVETGVGEAELRYKDIVFEDPENDPPAGTNEWTIDHTPKFLRHHGLSELHGKTLSTEAIYLDKVGLYTIRLQAQDDPNPDYLYPDDTFAEYRKSSEMYEQRIVVHRRPIADFDLIINEDYTIDWIDKSYDPDRWFSNTEYSTENTGIDYRSTRGIMPDKRFSYTDPLGETFNEKLMNPRISGVYTVRLQVVDEYGAWSQWAVKTIQIDDVSPNTPPEAKLTFPTGTQAAPTIVSELRPTITWNQTDEDPDTVFTGFHIQVRNEAGNIIQDTGELSQNRTQTHHSYRPSTNFPAGQKLNVRVRVKDEELWSEWSNVGWMYINRPPVAVFDWSPKPVWEGDLVTLTNQSYDPDGDPLTYVWTITPPSGQPYTYTSTNVFDRFRIPGNYRVQLTVSDGIATSTVSQTITAHPLIIEPGVHHTPNWLEIHQNNGHNTTEEPKDFYSGEILMLTATSSPAPVERVEAWMDTVGRANNRIRMETTLTATNEPTQFTGELYDPVLMSLTEGLPKGLEDVHFRIVYQNGTVKEATVRIRIIGNAKEAVGVKRRH